MLRSAINHYYQGEFEKEDIADILLCEPTCLHITSGLCVCVWVLAPQGNIRKKGRVLLERYKIPVV